MNPFTYREYHSTLLPSNHKPLTSHLAIVAHQDDAEIIGYSGIQACFQQQDQWFSTITMTNGGGASRGGRYRDVSNDALSEIRQSEQEKAAVIGEYAFCQQWQCSSQRLKENSEQATQQLAETLAEMKPSVIYTHNPFDRHATHVTVMKITLAALQRVIGQNPDYQPTLFGVEVWGSLDWLPDHYRIELDCSKMPNLEQALIGVHDSQIDGNKGYDTAVLGRRRANATFASTHSEDQFQSVNLAIDLTQVLIGDASLSKLMSDVLTTFTEEKLEGLGTFA